MKPRIFQNIFCRLFFAGSGLLCTAQIAWAADAEAVAVSSNVSSDYKRTKMADGSFAPETFAFANGGPWKDAAHDASIDNLKFIDVATALSEPLAHQNYISSKDPKNTKLLIMVYWGKTVIPGSSSDSVEFQNAADASSALATAKGTGKAPDIKRSTDNLAASAEMEELESKERDKIDGQNAILLGYDKVWRNTLISDSGAMGNRHQDLVNELEDRRYFVILMAYDFQLLWKDKKKKVLWETRYSIRDRGHELDKEIAAMSKNASKYFGQESNGLVHRDMPEGTIETGEIKVIDHPATPDGK